MKEPHPIIAFSRILPEELTPSEANVLKTYRPKLALHFYATLLASYTAVYAATWKFPKNIQSYLLAPVASINFAGWMLEKSADSCLDNMLALNGTMLQKKVANIMMTQSPNHPTSVRLRAKHFYSERVLDDSTSDTPKLRWRYRNIFTDNVVHGHGTLALDDFYNSSCHYDPYYKFRGSSYNDESQCESTILTDSKRTTLRTNQNLIKSGPDIMSEVEVEDPIDCLFGYRATMEAIDHPNTSKKPQGTHNRGHRRFHRRRRMHNYNDLSNSDQAAIV